MTFPLLPRSRARINNNNTLYVFFNQHYYPPRNSPYSFACQTNDMVCNLVKTLAHHRHRAAHVPMTDEEHALNRVVVRELTQTVQTIFKI